MLHNPLSRLSLIIMEQDQPQRSLKPFNNNNNNNNNNISTKKVSISILVISLPLLYVSLLHVPFSCLFKDTTFWFLISNSIIILVAADSGMFAGSSSSSSTENIYDEYINHSRARSAVPPPPPQPPQLQTIVKEEKTEEAKQIQDKTQVNVDEQQSPKESNEDERSRELRAAEPVVMINEKETVSKQPRYDRSLTELPEKSRVAATATKNLVPRSSTMMVEKRTCGMEESEYWKMSDEELNKRVEEFIRRFNREIRLQKKMSTVY